MDERERELVALAVRETLRGLGLDVDDPRGMQADFVFLRQLRRTAQTNRGRLLWIMVGAVATATITAIFTGLPWKGG